MENTKTESNVDNYGGKFAFLFVFLTVLIGTSAILPMSVLQESGLVQGTERSAVRDNGGVKYIQTGRYLKVPSRF